MSQIVGSNGSEREDTTNIYRFDESRSIDNLVTIERSPMVPIDVQLSGPSSPPPYATIPGTVPLYMGGVRGPPPSYDDVINPEAPPPSYQSLFGQVREARKSSNGFFDFIRKLFLLLIGTIGCTIVIGFAIVIPLSMVILGLVYMNDCPLEKIPEFLFIGGMIWIFKNLMNMWAQCRRSGIEADSVDAVRFRKHESLLNCFLFGWFVAGCVIIYRVYEPEFIDKTSQFYCNRTVYMFAFWLVTSTFILFALFMTCLCGLTLSAVFSSNSEEQEN